MEEQRGGESYERFREGIMDTGGIEGGKLREFVGIGPVPAW
jgi:hypothetical protein